MTWLHQMGRERCTFTGEGGEEGGEEEEEPEEEEEETSCESFVSDTVTDFGFSLSTVSLPALHHESPRGARLVDLKS